MDDEARADRDTENPRKLNFNAPLLSTRRPNSVSDSELPGYLHADSGNRVPFSWEKSPGKPKGSETCDQSLIDSPIPPPRPPPGWKPTLKQLIHRENEYDGDDDDDDDDDDDNDNFSDAIDTFSLSEALDIMIESAAGGSLTLDQPEGSESPSFIIQRFLSDAKALAVSSGLNIPKTSSNTSGPSDIDHFPGKSCVPRGVNMESCSSPKGCGLDVFFPWRMIKSKPCGVKSPVRVLTSSGRSRTPYNSKQQKQSSSFGQSPSRSGVSLNFSSVSNSKK